MVEFELKFKLSYAIAVSLISLLAGTSVGLPLRRGIQRLRRRNEKK